MSEGTSVSCASSRAAGRPRHGPQITRAAGDLPGEPRADGPCKPDAVPESMGEDFLHGMAIAVVVSTERPRSGVLQMMQYLRSVMDEDAGGGGKARKSLSTKKNQKETRDRQNPVVEFCLSFFLLLVVLHEKI